MRRTHARDEAHGPQALLLTPSEGLGGGIERVGASVEAAWPGEVTRLDLHRPGARSANSKVRFSIAALEVATRRELAWVCCIHIGLLPLASVVARTAHARLLVVAHGREVFGVPSRLSSALTRRSDRVVAVSEFTADVLSRRMKLARRPHVLHLPVARSMIDAAATGAREAHDPEMLLSVGRIASDTQYKGWHDVALAVASLRADHPRLRWHVVGDGDRLGALRAHCQALGIAGSVDFTQRASDRALAELYRRAYIFVLPSVANPEATPPIGEGFGLVYAEAGAFGVPSVGSARGGGALDFVKHGQTGLTVRLESPGALAASISWLVRNRSERDRLGQAARELAMSEHSQDRFAERLGSVVGSPLRMSIPPDKLHD